MTDIYSIADHGIESPARNAESATPSGSDVVLSNTSRGIYIGGAGNITVDMENVGTNITFTGVLGGVTYPFKVTKIYDTGTTATNIVALW